MIIKKVIFENNLSLDFGAANQRRVYGFTYENFENDILIATDKEIGQTMQRNSFGKCNKQPSGTDYLPCQINITKWNGVYQKVTYSRKGRVLLEDSKATCPMGAPNCITITDHGQTANLSQKNINNTAPQILAEILPRVNFHDFDDEALIIKNTQDE